MANYLTLSPLKATARKRPFPYVIDLQLDFIGGLISLFCQAFPLLDISTKLQSLFSVTTTNIPFPKAIDVN